MYWEDGKAIQYLAQKKKKEKEKGKTAKHPLGLFLKKGSICLETQNAIKKAKAK